MKLIVLVISLSLMAMSALADMPHDGELPNTVAPVRAAVDVVIDRAKALLGVNYKYGGKTPKSGFDCSGFISHVFREAAGVALPPNALQMSRLGDKVAKRQLLPGDLVFYNTLKRAFSHVGIYLGDGRFIHAPSKGKSVEIAVMSDNYWGRRFQGARRVADLEQTLPTTDILPPDTVAPDIVADQLDLDIGELVPLLY